MKMKKVLAIVGIAVVSAATMFANVEINPRVFADFLNLESKMKILGTDVKTEINVKNYGVELEGNLWLAQIGTLDLGLNAAVDAGFGSAESKFKVEALGANLSSSKRSTEVGFSIAPAVQYNLGEKHSLFFAPGFKYSLIHWEYQGYVDTGLGGMQEISANKTLECAEFTLDVGYKFWLSNFLGLNAGYKYEMPLSIKEGGSKLDLDSKSANRIYLGCCLNFGKRNTAK